MAAVNCLRSALWFSLLIATGCSADLPQAPTNQIIKGPFTITTEWQTIKFDQPLKTLPHIQRLETLLDMDNYEPVYNIGESEYNIIGHSYLSRVDNIPIRAEIIFIDSKGDEYIATKNVLGSGARKKRDINI